jgi:predicted MPP superfamily phosphohydrolase
LSAAEPSRNSPTASDHAGLALLEARLGYEGLRRRLQRERDYERRVVRNNRYFLHLESWRGLIRGSARLAGLHGRGRRNARALELRRNELCLRHLPAAFDGFTLLQLSDLHLDLNADIVDTLIERVRPLDYDLCVLTGDYRARTVGPFDAALAALERLRGHIKGPAYAVLGNHDTIRMVPRMEAMGFRLLLDEWTRIERGDASLCLAGIDDARSGRTENIRRATRGMPDRAVSILLSHRPGAYRHAAQAGFSLMLSGHTHGGQICLPGGIPLFTDGESPRALARGAWRYQNLLGYTSAGSGASLVDLRFNCPPEVTLHRLRCGDT